MKTGYVYMMSNQKHGTLYIGVTSDLIKRVYEHKHEITGGFTKRYQLKHLIYYETLCEMSEAIRREKRLKKYPREWKINLIEELNPDWEDLYDDICGCPE